MTRAEGKFLVAETRGDALKFCNSLKAQISLALRNNTPVICLACEESSPTGDRCTKGFNMDQVREKEMFGETASPDTLLVDICEGFTSTKMVLSEQQLSH